VGAKSVRFEDGRQKRRHKRIIVSTPEWGVKKKDRSHKQELDRRGGGVAYLKEKRSSNPLREGGSIAGGARKGKSEKKGKGVMSPVRTSPKKIRNAKVQQNWTGGK